MKVNFNKDLILKHKFWIMLMVSLPIVGAGLFILLVPVADAIATQKAKVLKELTDAKKVGGNWYNPKDIEDLLRQVERAQKKEYDVWGHVFNEQAEGLFWPDEFEKKYPMHKGKFLRELKYVEGGAAPVDDEHHFSGTIIDKDNLAITVKNKQGKTEKFYRVYELDMKLDRDNFFNLQVGKEVAITYQTARYFNDRLHDIEQSDYVKSYLNQLRPILDIVEPVNEDGEGVVQLRDWLYPKKGFQLPHEVGKDARFLRYVPVWNAASDISEEAWIAQEDLWVQKEFYRLIRGANDYVSQMERDQVKDGKKGTFRNPNYELTLELLDTSKLKVTIRNLRNQRQKLDVNFRVRFNEEKGFQPEKFHVEGEPLDPPGTIDPKTKAATDVATKEIDLGAGPPRTGIYSVHQVLTWDTAAVRRIDQISIGSMAAEDMSVNHRVYPDGTRTLVLEVKKEGDLQVEGGDAGGQVVRPVFPGGPGGGQGAEVKFTTNRLIKNRYLEVTDQARRLPVAIALIVDQDHIDRVLTAFGNSKFRFLLNQVLLNRYPATLRPTLPSKDDKLPGGGLPFPFPFPAGGFGEGGGGRGMFPIQGPGPGQLQPGQGGEEEIEANVELVLYGFVTLYERFPPRRIPARGDAPTGETAKQ